MNHKEFKIIYDNFDTITKDIKDINNVFLKWLFRDYINNNTNIKDCTIWSFNFTNFYTLKGLYNRYKQGIRNKEEFKGILLKKIYEDLLYYKFLDKYNINYYRI